MCFACKGHPQDDLYCVRWDIKPYSLIHSLAVIVYLNVCMLVYLET